MASRCWLACVDSIGQRAGGHWWLHEVIGGRIPNLTFRIPSFSTGVCSFLCPCPCSCPCICMCFSSSSLLDSRNSRCWNPDCCGPFAIPLFDGVDPSSSSDSWFVSSSSDSWFVSSFACLVARFAHIGGAVSVIISISTEDGLMILRWTLWKGIWDWVVFLMLIRGS